MATRWLSSSRPWPEKPMSWSAGSMKLRHLFDAREYDAVVSSGENITAGLMALTLQEMDVPARSWQGWQVPLLTTSRPFRQPGSRRSRPRTSASEIRRRHEGRRRGRLSGSQPRGADHYAGPGWFGHHRRGFCRCALGGTLRHLYGCGRGLYHGPAHLAKRRASWTGSRSRKCSNWPRLGAKVLQTRSVELAMRYKVKACGFCRVLKNRSDDNAGTLVCDEEDIMESNVVAGVAFSAATKRK